MSRNPILLMKRGANCLKRVPKEKFSTNLKSQYIADDSRHSPMPDPLCSSRGQSGWRTLRWRQGKRTAVRGAAAENSEIHWTRSMRIHPAQQDDIVPCVRCFQSPAFPQLHDAAFATAISGTWISSSCAIAPALRSTNSNLRSTSQITLFVVSQVVRFDSHVICPVSSSRPWPLVGLPTGAFLLCSETQKKL
jgi:hypothetical protein